MPKLKPGTIWPTEEEDAEITAAALTDPDNLPWTDEEMAKVTFIRNFGRPKAAVTKERITIRLSPEVLAKFRQSGPGWQTKIDAALKDWLQTNPI